MTLGQAKEAFKKIDLDCSVPVLIAGDTNFDSQLSLGFIEFMLEEYCLQYLKTSCTTDYGSTIDQAFTNVALDELYKWGTLESYYSDHKPVFVSMK